MKLRISVIMGIYNCAPTLQEALDSLYAQTYQGFKIILCDDGSTDDTLKIAEENARLHDNVLVIRNERNMGLNYTLNHCLKYADTEYIARMDGDDFSHSTRFERQIQFLDANQDYAIVSNPMVFFDENGEFMRGRVSAGEPLKTVFNYGSPFCHAPCMVRSEAYKMVGGYTEDKKLLRMEDYNLWMKMYASGYKGYNLPDYLYYMRDDKNAINRRTLKARINGIYAHWLAYKVLDLSFLLFCKYAFFNVVLGVMPKGLYKVLRRLHYR